MSANPDRLSFEVTVADTALEPAVAADVVEIEVHEEVGCHGRCTLLVQNWDPEARAVRHSDDGPFAPGAALAVSLGYHSELTPVFGGVIASVSAHFPAKGRPLMRVEARSRSILLDHPPRSRQLAEVSDADVANAIAADYSLTADADDGIKHAAIVSDRQSDWEFLRERAERLGWALYVRDDALVFRAPAAPEDPPALEFTRDLVELHLTEDLARAIDSATGAGWDVGAKDAVSSEQGASSSGIDTGDRDAHDAAVGDAGWPLRGQRDETPAAGSAEAADALAIARQRDAALAHVYGRGIVAGDPKLRCDGWVEVSGIGRRFSGPHYLTAVRHRLAPGGYTTELQFGRPPALVPRAGAVRVPTGAGLHLGVVDDLEDPESMGRVRVRLPWREDSGDGVWARVATLDAGDGYGTVFIPNAGQEVLVGYIDGDASAPVVVGQLYNGTAKPPMSIDPDANAVRAVVTPGGHALTLDDGDAAAMSLVSAKDNSVVIDDANGAVVVTHGDSGNSITVSADGIELSAAKGDITLKAPSGTVKIDAKGIEGKATGPSKLESSATFDLTASGPLKLKGALVNIN